MTALYLSSSRSKTSWQKSLHLKWLIPRIHPKSKLKTNFLFGEKVLSVVFLKFFFLIVFVKHNATQILAMQHAWLNEWHISTRLKFSLVTWYFMPSLALWNGLIVLVTPWHCIRTVACVTLRFFSALLLILGMWWNTCFVQSGCTFGGRKLWRNRQKRMLGKVVLSCRHPREELTW